jgi:predicted acylesterase/phospholipase RssA
MKAFRPNLALAIDGGGIRGTIVAKALAEVEEAESISFSNKARLLAGTSTGSIISAGLSVGLSAARIHKLYVDLAGEIFPKTWRSRLWLLTTYRYSNEPLINAVRQVIGEVRLGDLWTESHKKDLVIVLRDLVENRNRFVKPWKEEFKDWRIWEAAVASSTVPTYFPVFKGRYVDGGVGSYSNPSYVAAYEAAFVLKDFPPEETTLISLGTGSATTGGLTPGAASRLRPWQWIGPIVDAFSVDAARQQVHLVHRFFEKLDFRRFQIEMTEAVAMDDISNIDLLTAYGEKMGEKILNDQWEKPELPDEPA